MLKLIELPYPINALEPVISEKTINFHHGKHLQGYVDNLNKLILDTQYEKMPLEEIVKSSTGGIFNNAGQILNHNLYFEQFKAPQPEETNLPSANLGAQIEKQWGSFQAFKEEFTNKGATLFGSGWVWLSAQQDGTLIITQEPDANNPITKGLKPLLTFDVWEHAYYLDFQNRRSAHLQALWSIIDWNVVEERFIK